MTQDDKALCAHLQQLEVELHHPGRPCDVERLEALLHPDFHEVGRSGRAYDRATVVRYLSQVSTPPQVDSSQFRVERLTPDVALLSYCSVQRPADGSADLRTLRSSLWTRGLSGWQLRHHQGTPAASQD
ncbi:nuclear transport factor 2 family protein [uncultured Pseudacidovorax sp.]|uniref:nuclear transport factor 2 family protein n=1 Tax=uncultured Pseudacidovorax sp. TaxID=679313 RepID=UPI0025EC2601|nr:nuclear transport factor 2 family protein [uncultured Pseudacidovorax sp.]